MSEKEKPNIGRRILLSGHIDEQQAKRVIERALELEAEDPAKHITILIDSFGGYLDSMYAIVDTLRGLQCEVHTVCMGKAMSAGVFVLACGAAKGHRFITPNARVMLHEVQAHSFGSSSQIQVEATEVKRMQQKMITDMAKVTEKSEEQILADFKKTTYLTAEQAKEYGIVDEIVSDWTQKSDKIEKPGFDDKPEYTEIRYRVRDPGSFKKNAMDNGETFARFDIVKKSPKVHALIGKLKSDGKTAIQSLRFPKKDKWTIDKARKWVKDHPDVTKTDADKVTKSSIVNQVTFISPCADDDTECQINIRKAAEKRIVYGVVYEPDVVDTQGEWTDSEEIEKAAHKFVADFRDFNIEHHGKLVKVALVESFCAPNDMTIGAQRITEGTWVIGTRVDDDELWADVKAGKIVGFSLQGTAVRS